jgi:hypothetical protein
VDWFERIPRDLVLGGDTAAGSEAPVLKALRGDGTDEKGMGDGFEGADGTYVHAVVTLGAQETLAWVAAARAHGVTLWALVQAAWGMAELAIRDERGGDEGVADEDVRLVAKCVADARPYLSPPVDRQYVCTASSVALGCATVSERSDVWSIAADLRQTVLEDLEALRPLVRLRDAEPHAVGCSIVNNYGSYEGLGNELERRAADGSVWRWEDCHIIHNDAVPRELHAEHAACMWTFRGLLHINVAYAPAHFHLRTIRALATTAVHLVRAAVAAQDSTTRIAHELARQGLAEPAEDGVDAGPVEAVTSGGRRGTLLVPRRIIHPIPVRVPPRTPDRWY